MEEEKTTAQKLKEIIVNRLSLDMAPEDIGDTQPLFGNEEGDLGLDSVEALEIVVGIEEIFGLWVENDEETIQAFTTVATLAEFIDRKIAEGAVGVEEPRSDEE